MPEQVITLTLSDLMLIDPADAARVTQAIADGWTERAARRAESTRANDPDVTHFTQRAEAWAKVARFMRARAGIEVETHLYSD